MYKKRIDLCLINEDLESNYIMCCAFRLPQEAIVLFSLAACTT